MRPLFLALVIATAAAGGAFATFVLMSLTSKGQEVEKPSQKYPAGKPIDAAAIGSGTLDFERMPKEVTGALEVHANEIARTALEVARKQARITGTCSPGSAIRVVGEDGSVVCQRLPRGVASVTAVAATPRISATGTSQGTVPGAVGRYQTSGEDDFLVVPINLPDGAIVTRKRGKPRPFTAGKDSAARASELMSEGAAK